MPGPPAAPLLLETTYRSKLASLHILELFSARRTEVTQQVDGPTFCHVTQFDEALFDEALVRLKIRVQNLSSDGIGAIHYRLGRQDPHPAELRIKAYQTGNIRLIVLKRVDVAFAGVFNEPDRESAAGSSRAGTIEREPESDA
jgi:hypothetical protein